MDITDKNDPVWLEVTAWANQELAQLRELNDTHRPDHETAAIRGSIKILKKLLDHNNDQPHELHLDAELASSNLYEVE